MKLATFVAPNGKPAVGLVDTDRQAVLNLSHAARVGGRENTAFVDMLTLIDGGLRLWLSRNALGSPGPQKQAYRSPA